MGVTLRFISLGMVLVLSTGCWTSKSLTDIIDDWLFRHIGDTLFCKSEHLSLKEIHLDNGLLMGRQVYVEGVIERVGDLGTFLVISDQSARLLVVLTDVENVPQMVQGAPETLQVLGKVESGKKGLPVVRALSLRLVARSESGVSKNSDSKLH